ncbi:unnamed protein product [Boreogadus saida]
MSNHFLPYPGPTLGGAAGPPPPLLTGGRPEGQKRPSPGPPKLLHGFSRAHYTLSRCLEIASKYLNRPISVHRLVAVFSSAMRWSLYLITEAGGSSRMNRRTRIIPDGLVAVGRD